MLRLAPHTTTTLRHRANPWWRGGLAVGVGIVLWSLAARSGVTTITPPAGGTPLVLAVPRAMSTNPVTREATESLITGNNATVTFAPKWRAPTAVGVGTPCLHGDELYLVEAAGTARDPRLVAWDRRTGDRRWSATIPATANAEERAPTAVDHQAASRPDYAPVCDGERVFVPWSRGGELWLHAFTRDGTLDWSVPVGPAAPTGPYPLAPVLHGPLVLLAVDQDRVPWLAWQPRSYVVAVHRLTGQIIWRTLRPDGASAGCPVVARVGERPQLLLAGRGGVRGYDPDTGNELWACRWKGTSTAGPVVTDGLHVYAAAAAPEGELVCVRGDGAGDVTTTHVVWRDRRTIAGTARLALAGETLVQQQSDGTILALESLTGRTLWRVRLPTGCSAPPVLAGRQWLCLDDAGVLHALDLDRRGEAIWEGPLPRGGATAANSSIASPSERAFLIQGSELYLRDREGLTTLTPALASPLVQEPERPARTR